MKNNSKKKFISTLSQHLSNIMDALNAVHIYERLFIQSQNSKSDIKKINLAPAFFSTVHNALITDFVTITMKLYDNNKDNKSETIKKIIDFAKGNIGLFNERITRSYIMSEDSRDVFSDNFIAEFNAKHKNKRICKSDDNIREIHTYNTKIKCKVRLFEYKFHKHQQIINDLKKLRNEYYMHNDKKNFLSQTNLPILPLDNIKTLLDFAYSVCNTLHLNLTKSNTAPTAINIDDINILLDHIIIPS